MTTHVPRHTAPPQQRLLDKIYAKKAAIDRAERPRVRDFFASNIVRWLLLANGVVLLCAAGLLGWFIRPTQYDIILHYNAFFGVSSDMFAPWWHAYRIVIFGAGVLCVNGLLAFWSYRGRERIASYIFLLGAFLTQLSLLIDAIAVVIVNR